MLSQKGSFTIEATVWIPVLLMVLTLSLKTGISIYKEIVSTDYREKTKQLDVVQEFYEYQILEEVMQEATDD